MILGITSQNHDASMALIDGSNILWAAHSERYTRIKNDRNLNLDMVKELYTYGSPKQIVWFERPWPKNIRRLWSGERPWYQTPKEELKKLGLGDIPVEYVWHHESHAAAGYYTSGFDRADIIVIDAIGEWDTVSYWKGANNKIKKQWSKKYPNSIGLFYTAFTHYLGLKPNEEEYILMGMAALGEPKYVNEMIEFFFDDWNPPDLKLKHNLHQGCKWWERPEGATDYDIAASVQAIYEKYIIGLIATITLWLPVNKNLVLMGGCALNCVANSKIARTGLYENIWIMPNPGDAGSAIGAVAALTEKQLNWNTPYLGTDIDRELDIDSIVKELLDGKVVAVANGRAEFGPRALGNRSLLCDPRGPDAKVKMNKLKKREAFRPFAPAVLAEHADTYFKMPVKETQYMQFTAECLQPNLLPGVCHYDNSSRVQTVNTRDNPKFRELLELWYAKSGCPILMNTSLNIKGEPLVNSWDDAIRWQNKYNVKVY